MVALRERDDAAAKAGAGEPGPVGAALDGQLHQEVELGGRHREVITKARVAGEHQPAQRVRVTGAERVGELEHARVLRDDMASDRVVTYRVERCVTECS